MILTNELLIEAPIATVWKLFDDLENVLPCMPGAAYLGREGDSELVTLKVKVGAITSNFEGAVRFLEKDEAAGKVVIRGSGKDKGGKATANATIESQLEALPAGRTRVIVKTDLALTGKLAQFGGGMIADISHRLVDQFAANLHQAVVQKALRVAPAPEPSVEPVALGEVPAAPAAHVAGAAPATAGAANPAALDLGNLVVHWAWKQGLRHLLIPLAAFALGWICAKALG